MGIPLKAVAASHDPGNFRPIVIDSDGRKLHGFVRNRDLRRRPGFFRPGFWYLDLSLIESYWGSNDRAYHHTAPISMVYALREGLRITLEEGLEARWARHVRNHKALKAGLEAMGLQYTAAPGCQLPQLNAVRIPTGVDDVAGRNRLLTEFGIEVGGGLGDFKGKAWRIGLMGYNSRPACVLLVLAALEQVLASCGVVPGSGVAAAEKVYGAA